MKTKKKRFIIAIISIIILFILIVLFLIYRNSKPVLFKYVQSNHIKLEEFVLEIKEKGSNNLQTTYHGWDVHFWANNDFIIFTTGAFGFGSETSYRGFYYSPNNIPLGFYGETHNFIPYEDGWIWEQTDGDNKEYTEKIMDNWFWFEMSF